MCNKCIDNITDIERGKPPLFFGVKIGKNSIDKISGQGAMPY